MEIGPTLALKPRQQYGWREGGDNILHMIIKTAPGLGLGLFHVQMLNNRLCSENVTYTLVLL